MSRRFTLTDPGCPQPMITLAEGLRARLDPSDPDRTVRRWAVGIGVLGLLAFVWMVTLGRWDLFQERPFSEMLDVQSRAMLHGHLWVPDGLLGFEGFIVDGRTYAYFGIFPSLLRFPIFLFTDAYDGRLSALSMTIAWAVAYGSAVRLLLRVRRLQRGDAAWSRGGSVIAVAALASVAIGSNLFYMASAAWVYHEATLWGIAGVLAAFGSIVGWLIRPSGRALIAAALWTTVAWLSRGSVGLGPTVALGLIGLSVWRDLPLLRWVAPVPAAARRGLRTAVPVVVAGAIGAMAFASVNVAKFGSPTELPMDKQIQSIHPVPARAAALDAYDGTIFSPRLVPAVTVQMLRPDLVRPSATWPFVAFTRRQPAMLGAPVFDTVEASAGLTATHPLLLALALAGLVAVLRPSGGRRRDTEDEAPAPDLADPRLASLRPLLAGSALGAMPVLTIAFISQRYVTDVLPLVIVAAFAGVSALDGWCAQRASAPAWRRRLAPAAAVGLAIVSVWVTVAVTWSFQRLESPPDVAARAAALHAQATVADVVGRPPGTLQGTITDRPATAGELLVVGDCAGLYVGQSDGVWSPIETTGKAGVPTIRLSDRPAVGADPVPVLSTDELTLYVSSPSETMLRVDLVRPPRADAAAARVTGTAFSAPAGPVELTVDLDDNLSMVKVWAGDREVLFDPNAAGSRDYRVGPGAAGVTVTEVTTPTPVCDALTR